MNDIRVHVNVCWEISCKYLFSCNYNKATVPYQLRVCNKYTKQEAPGALTLCMTFCQMKPKLLYRYM